MNDSKFYNLLIKKLIMKFNYKLNISEEIYFYKFKINNNEYTLKHHVICETYFLESKTFFCSESKYVAKKLANLLGYG